jgi:hypothetical protein
VGISKGCKGKESDSKSEEDEQQRATQQPTNNKAGNGKGSEGEASGAQKQRGGAVARNTTTNKQLSRDQQRLQRGCKQQQY